MTARRESRPVSLFVAMVVSKSKAWAIVSATEVVNIFVCVWVRGCHIYIYMYINVCELYTCECVFVRV